MKGRLSRRRREGMGPARERDPEAVRRDVRLGYLSREAALRDYGVDAEE